MKSFLGTPQGHAATDGAALTPVPGGPVWALVGPTACGKSAVAQACAELAGGELVGCDSVQVYRGFDVGSAKPSRAAMRAVPHHLVDCRDPDQPLHAMAYVQAARRALADVRARGKTAILCGGTGLYLRALERGLVSVASDAALRARLIAEVAADPAAGHARLSQLDPVGAANVHPNNPAYVVRALEICLLTGRPASEVRAEQASAATQAQGSSAGVALVVVALDGPSPWLRARIAHRATAMVEAGLVAEVRALLAAGVPPDCAPMRSVGYREASAVIRGELAEADLVDAIARSTWAYARRQRTWLRRSPPAHRIDASPFSGSRPLEDLAGAVLTAWRSGAPAGT